MYKKILIATDGSEVANKAVDHGLALAQSLGASVVFVTVTKIWSALDMASEFEGGHLDAIETYEKAAAKAATAILQNCMDLATSKGVSAIVKHVSDQKPAEGILKTADREDCDLIVMSTHGRRGLEKVLIGSQTSKVLASSSKPVLVLH